MITQLETKCANISGCFETLELFDVGVTDALVNVVIEKTDKIEFGIDVLTVGNTLTIDGTLLPDGFVNNNVRRITIKLFSDTEQLLYTDKNLATAYNIECIINKGLTDKNNEVVLL